MEKRQLGESGIWVSPLAFGGNIFGWTVDEKTSHQLLDQFVDGGFDLIDTANSYSRWVPGHVGGESETIIGSWIRKSGKRDKVIIATKVGSDMGLGKPCLTSAHIKQQVEQSLKRLNIEQIDLYQSHFDDVETPVSETMQAYADLIHEGKVRAIGASNLSPERLVASLDYAEQQRIPSYHTLQPEYNLYARKQFEESYEKLCTKHRLGVITYFSLASGFLTGKYRNEEDYAKSKRGGGMSKYLNERGMNILKALDLVSAEKNTSQASIAIAWLLSRATVTAPIASATNQQQLTELLAAVEITLSEHDLDVLNIASAY